MAGRVEFRASGARHRAAGVTAFAWLALLAPAFWACGAAQRAAQKDPMHCERDPNCARFKGSYADCTRQCVDNPECMDRCRQVQVDPGLGH
jgi:hypothetical protein